MSTKIKGIAKSSWTPLSNGQANNKIFDERRSLVNKWFDKWNFSQRKLILEDLLLQCNANQADYAREILMTKAAQNHVDFSRILPRVLCLYIFNFLDPRSLCRASQVCWYWKYLTETNEIWVSKCLKFGWVDGSIPLNSMEQGIWKRLFIQNVVQFQLSKVHKELTALELERLEEEENKRKLKKFRDKQLQKSQKHGVQGMRPWKGPDPRPIDIMRNNYIDNDVECGSKRREPRSEVKQYSVRRLSSSQERSHRQTQRSYRSIGEQQKNQSVEAPASYRAVTNTSKSATTEHSTARNLYNSNPINMHKTINKGNLDTNFVTQTHNTNGTTVEGEINGYTELTDIPSGRPWILPTHQDDDDI